MLLALADGWDLAGWTLEYAPVGAGSYHWTAALRAGRGPGERRFVTVDDLDGKGWLGRTGPAVLAGLRAAMDAAVTLRQAGLGFVAAPVPARTGETVRPLGHGHAITVFPYLDGSSGAWGEPLPAPERGELAAMLAALHQADPAAVRLPRVELALPGRGELEAALAELGQPWTGGPYSERARALLASAARPVRRHLDILDHWAPRLAAAPTVITHGEPHPGNVMRAPGGLMLIDWDTAGLAPPERDLWLVATESGDEVRRYTELTGHPVDPAALEFYRLRWALDDLSFFLRDLRAPHHPTPGTEDAWLNLETTLTTLTTLTP
jgi:spectinomycin phosphotransferase